MKTKFTPEYSGTLRSHLLTVPKCISECGGIRIFGRRIKSLVFSTDVAIIKNVNADAIIAVYPFTPQPSITQAIISVSEVPVFVGVGGGMTNGDRSVRLAEYSEHQGASGVVVNAPISNETIAKMKDGVTIINCARGELMHIPDMIRGIETQKIGALALDVFDKEDGIYHENRRDDILSNRDMAYLRQFPNVIMTQHMAFYTDAAVQSMVYCGIEGLCDFARTGHTATELV